MAYSDIQGNLEKVVQKSDKEATLEIKDKKGELHLYQFKGIVSNNWIGENIWYRQWKSGFIRKKTYQELILIKDPTQVIASQYPCPNI